jgi:serine phosphatase RsbU (regulator of sigma subunit)
MALARFTFRSLAREHQEPGDYLAHANDVVAEEIALGIEPKQTFEEVEIPLPPGAAIVLYTDGVIEARRDRELYGVERLDAVLRKCRGLSPEGLVRRVVEDCRAFGGELTDDVAVVAIKRG